jgi:hypothetical protein
MKHGSRHYRTPQLQANRLGLEGPRKALADNEPKYTSQRG